jgi:DNA-binding MarR family transcriptional regulator
MTMTDAAIRLGVPTTKISRMAKDGAVETKRDTLDKRVRLVDYEEVKRVLESSVGYQK